MGGASTKPNQFPWMVELVVVIADFFKQSTVTCGATLIKNQYLVTAAHCIYHRYVTPDYFYIFIKSLKSKNDLNWRS
jgi:secreted trypsin-like serine protease